MKKQLLSFLVTVGILIVFMTGTRAQSAELSGRVVNTSEQGIGDVTVKLVSSLGESGPHYESKSHPDGKFSLIFDWNKVNEANKLHATWKVYLEKDGYNPEEIKVVLSSGPEPVRVVLTSSAYTKYFPIVDGCLKQGTGPYTLYFFDLQKPQNLDDARLNMSLQILIFNLDKDIKSDLKSYGCLENNIELTVITRCSVSVKENEAAVSFGHHLKSPGVIWGYVEEEKPQYKATIAFTALNPEPILGFSNIPYSEDFSRLINPREPVDKEYLAFSSFVLGNIHLLERRTDVALKCFNHARQLNALPQSLRSKLDEILRDLEKTNPGRDLKPIAKR